jgi:hypothetical protein
MVCKQLSAIVPETAVFLKIPAAKRKNELVTRDDLRSDSAAIAA